MFNHGDLGFVRHKDWIGQKKIGKEMALGGS